MRSSGLRLLLVLFGVAKSALAQAPIAEAPAEKPEAGPSEAAPTAEPGSSTAAEPAPAAESAPTSPAPEAAPAVEKTPEVGPASEAPRAAAIGRPSEVAPQATGAEPLYVPWVRAHSPLTLEGKLGFLVRPESSAGFDDESHVGAEVGGSLYFDLKKEIAAGLELERASLGRGVTTSGRSTVSVDYSVTSAMLGFRAYPKRTELIDLFVGLQVGLGLQRVSAAGTRTESALAPAVPYKCGSYDAPAFQIGGGVGARLMISPRWGLTARVNGTGRRLSSERIDECAQGIGTATTVSAGIGLGYDFDLDPDPGS